jgi:ketosteroid isomerase-like protein
MAARPDEQELIELEKRYWRAIKDRDADAAMRMSDDPCFVTGAQGVARLDRQALGGMMRGASWTLREFDLTDVHVRMLRSDVAILVYRVREELTVDGKPVTLEAADSSTWVRRDGRWVCSMHTEAISGDPFGRDRQRAH